MHIIRKVLTGRVFWLVCVVTLSISIMYIVHSGARLSVAEVDGEDVDVVFTFAGQDVRIGYSRTVADQSNAVWVVSDPRFWITRRGKLTDDDLARVKFVRNGINTYQEVKELGELLVSEAIPSNSKIGLVSSPHHMRRVSMMAERYLRPLGYEPVLIPVPQSIYEKFIPAKNYERWWADSRLRNEAIKNLGYKLYLYKVGFITYVKYLPRYVASKIF